MLQRTETQTPTEMAVYGRFEGIEHVSAPAAYLVPDSLVAVTERLAIHGVAVASVAAGSEIDVEIFEVDSVQTAKRAFQNRYEQELFGRYEPATVTLDHDVTLVPVNQPLGRLAVLLLEPRSDSGFAGWGLVPAQPDAPYPIYRVASRDAVEKLTSPTD